MRLTPLAAKVWLNIYILLSFIDHSFEERRKVLKIKQHEGSVINIKLI